MQTIMQTRTINFRETVPAATGVEIKKPCQISGHISKVIIFWPIGCIGLVQVAVVHLDKDGKTEGIIPSSSGTYLALDGANPVFNIHFPVEMGDHIMVIIRNADAVNPHTISVDIFLTPPEKR